MEPIKCKGETDFHSVTDMNHEQEGEVLDLDKQVDPNSSSNTLMVSKVTQQFNGAPIPTFIYNNDAVRAICVKAPLPEHIHVSFLNEYDCMLGFPTEFELHKTAMDLQKITQNWKLNWVEPNPSPSLDVIRKIFETPTSADQQIE